MSVQIPETEGGRTFGEEPYSVGGRALLAQVVPRLQRIRQDDCGQHQQRSRPQRLQSFTLFCSGQGVDSGLCLFSMLTLHSARSLSGSSAASRQDQNHETLSPQVSAATSRWLAV